MKYRELFTQQGEDELKLEHQYKVLDDKRSSVKSRNEQYAGWTLPYLFPTQDDEESGEVQYDYQSLGAQLVNNLANKVVKTLFHPARPFFRADLTDEQKLELRDAFGDDVTIDKELAKVERKCLKQFNKTNSMMEFVKAAKLAIVTGECLVQSDSNNNKIIHSSRDYVVERDRSGGMVRCIIKEEKSLDTLPAKLRKVCLDLLDDPDHDEMVSLYTGIVRDGTKYYVWQEINDFTVGHYKAGIYSIETLPFKFWMWDWMKGRTYAIGLVEANSGDFNALSRLASAIDDYTAIVTDLKILVNPSGSTDIAGINNSASGAAVAGVEEDISILKYEVAQAGEFLKWRFDELKRSLGAQFLYQSATTRDAERVTAEEIKRNALELENAHGGIYSRWAIQIQQPEAKRLLRDQDGALAKMDVTILTGLDSLARATELDNMRAYIADLASLSDLPEPVLIRTKVEGIMAILAAGHGVDDEKFMRDEKETEAEQERLMKLNAANEGMQAGAVNKAQGQQNG